MKLYATPIQKNNSDNRNKHDDHLTKETTKTYNSHTDLTVKHTIFMVQIIPVL